MKIAYLMQEGGPDIRQKPLNGPANHVRQIIRSLQGLGHEVRLLARYERQIWRSEDLDVLGRVDVPALEKNPRRLGESVIRGLQSRLHLPYLNWFDSIRFSRACLQELAGFDLYYERMGWMGYGAGLAARRAGVPLVLEANNGDHITELRMLGVAPRGLQLRLCLALMRATVGRAAHVVATGDGHRNRFIRQWGVPPEKVTVVENGSELASLLKREQLRSFQGPDGPARATRLVFLGAFEPWHGTDILLRATAMALAKGIALHLTLIGSGSRLAQVRTLIAELGLDAHVLLTGQLSADQFAPHLADADIGLSPYCGWMEFSGLKLFDYKAAGLAIITSGMGGQPATIQHGQTGWIVPPCDSDALCQAIAALASDPDLRIRLGRAARLEAERRHAWGHSAQMLEEIFGRVLTGFRTR
jgi:glycosyltransferase involved in cell wall biosynthesis